MWALELEPALALAYVAFDNLALALALALDLCLHHSYQVTA